jgi:hypothetical protein
VIKAYLDEKSREYHRFYIATGSEEEAKGENKNNSSKLTGNNSFS